MTRQEHLLKIAEEECCEVAQRISKAMRFGLDEVQPGQLLTNADRIRLEFADLLGAYDLLVADGLLALPSSHEIGAKKEKVAKYLEYSKQCGTLQ